MDLRGIVFNALGIEMATNQDLQITARVPVILTTALQSRTSMAAACTAIHPGFARPALR